jgi:hypothetical protein
MNRLTLRYLARDIVCYSIAQLIANRLDYWARRGSAERREAWSWAIKDTRRLDVEELLQPYPVHGTGRDLFAALRHRFRRRPRSSAEIIADQALGRRHARHGTWIPFRS